MPKFRFQHGVRVNDGKTVPFEIEYTDPKDGIEKLSKEISKLQIYLQNKSVDVQDAYRLLLNEMVNLQRSVSATINKVIPVE